MAYKCVGDLEDQQKKLEQINNPLLQQIKLHSAKLVDLQSLPQGNDVRLEGLSEETKKTRLKNVRWLVNWIDPEMFVKLPLMKAHPNTRQKPSLHKGRLLWCPIINCKRFNSLDKN